MFETLWEQGYRHIGVVLQSDLRRTTEDVERIEAYAARLAKKSGVSLAKRPASTTVKHRPVDPAAHAAFAAPIKGIAPEQR